MTTWAPNSPCNKAALKLEALTLGRRPVWPGIGYFERGQDKNMPKKSEESSTVLELRKDTAALKRLNELEELVNVPPERGGYRFSDWEKTFIKSLGELQPPVFSAAQRAKLDQIWHDVGLRKRPELDEKPANLFSNMSPEKQAAQRARAAKVKLPWEK